MSDKSNQLVIFLAFANDRENTLRYLRNLPDEARRLREVLEAAEKADLCEVVVRTNCTAEDIFKVFQDPQYRNRIAIFHYGGHANGYQLLLESADGQAVAANAGGFSAFLAQQKGMQLVFLNGCSTREQTQGLLNAKISAVISTSRSIDDKVATDFAYHFYQGLAGGASIHTAYNEAAASIQTSKGDDTRDIYVEGPDGTQDQPETDRWPWDLHLCEGGESAGQWNLPQAVDDPLFGLPPLSQQDLPESPYRYLNWFTRKDAEVFFGRGHQIREIYDRLTAPHSAPILLFYGQSGVGKSSLLDAGLIPRLEMDYEVRYLRRSDRGLLATLQSVFAADVTKSGLDSAWRDQEEKSGRPLIVFLDQAEEIFTRPAEHTPDEMEQFLQALKVIFDDPNRRPKGRLVLGFRKEWLAELETHLASRELPRSKVFLQPLDRRGVIEVVRGPTVSKRLRDRYGLSVGDDLPEIIADDLIEDRDSAIAPTLQILLTKLWTEAREENYEQPEFTQELYQKLKRDGILLRDFLDQQIAAFGEKHPEVVKSGLLLDILAMHTTALGTAGHCSLEELQQQYEHIGDALPELLQQCQDLHLLTVATSTDKDGDKSTRLAHDTLAPLVRERYDESDKPGQRARRILDNRSKDWQGEDKGTPLDEADLEVVKAGLTGTSTPNEAEKRLVAASEEQHRKQLLQRRNRKLATVFAVVVIALAGAFGWFQFIKAGKATTEAKVAATEAQVQSENAKKAATEAQANLALLSWGKGVESRDRDNRPTEAVHWFARAAASGDAGISSSARIAVTDAVRKSSLSQILEHEGLTGAVFNNDGARILSWSRDNTVRLWDVATGTEVIPQMKHDNGVRGAVFNVDETRILSWSYDKTVRLWDTVTGTELIPQMKHEEWVIGAMFNNDETRILSWSYDKTVRLWDVATGTEAITLLQHKGRVLGAVFNDDETRILSWSDDNIVHVWDVATGNEVIPQMKHDEIMDLLLFSDAVVGAVFNDDETHILSWGLDKTVRLWDVVTGNELIPQMKHEDLVLGAVFNDDETRILSWSRDNTVRLWDVATGNELITPLQHSDWALGAVFNDDETRILSWSRDKTVRLWDVATGTELIQSLQHGATVNDAVFTDDETRILSWSFDKTVRLWDTVTGNEVITPLQHKGRVLGAVFNDDETRILSWSSDNTVRLWDVANGTDETRIFSWSSDKTVRLWDVATGTQEIKQMKVEDLVLGAVFNDDETRILSWSDDRVVRLRDTVTGTELITQLQHKRQVLGAVINDDETRILSWSNDRTVRLWDVATGTELITPLRHEEEVRGAMLNDDDTRILSWGIHFNTVRLWDVATGTEVVPQMKHDKGVLGAVFNADETRILSWSRDNTVRLWDVATGTEVITPLHHKGGVLGAVLNDDNTRILSWGYDIRLWDTVTGNELITTLQHEKEVRGAVFNNDETSFLSWSDDNTVRLWDVATGTEVIPQMNHDMGVRGAVFNDDETRILSWSKDKTVRLWDVATGTELITPLQHKGGVRGAVFTDDETRVLSWSANGIDQDDISYDAHISPEKLILQIQVRTGTYLTLSGQLEFLSAADWHRIKLEYENQ